MSNQLLFDPKGMMSQNFHSLSDPPFRSVSQLALACTQPAIRPALSAGKRRITVIDDGRTPLPTHSATSSGRSCPRATVVLELHFDDTLDVTSILQETASAFA